MPLQPIARRSLGDQVFDQLSAQILRGELASGATLPAERALVEVLGVNRQAVREALKRLEQAGLVDVQHGGGTTVNDWRRRAGLDLLPALVVTSDGTIDPAVVRSIMEFRAVVGPEVAARCAERVVASVRAELTDLAGRYGQVDGDATLQHLGELDVALWNALVDGSDNIAFRLAYNALRSQSEAAGELLLQLLVEEVSAVDLRLQLIDEVLAGKAADARATAAALLATGTAAMAKAMTSAAPASPPHPPASRGSAR